MNYRTFGAGRILVWLAAASGVLLTACATLNVQFPVATVQSVADRVIDEVWGALAQPPAAPARTTSSFNPFAIGQLALRGFDFVLPVAQAEGAPDLDASSPEIQRLVDSMEARFKDLLPNYDSGAVGFAADGYIMLRDSTRVPQPERNTLRTLVANENADRTTLYRELAVSNGQSHWEKPIRAVFAKRWIQRAKAGWYVQDGSAWKKR